MSRHAICLVVWYSQMGLRLPLFVCMCTSKYTHACLPMRCIYIYIYVCVCVCDCSIQWTVCHPSLHPPYPPSGTTRMGTPLPLERKRSRPSLAWTTPRSTIQSLPSTFGRSTRFLLSPTICCCAVFSEALRLEISLSLSSPHFDLGVRGLGWPTGLACPG